MSSVLKVNEVYASVQGEGSRAGLPFVFIRLTGCALRCRWCDTSYAFTEGEDRGLEELAEEALSWPHEHVLLTGGDPLEQPAAFELAARLIAAGRTVLVETGGHVDISPLPAGVITILDIKCPGSRMEHRNLWSNLERLTAADEVKFVIADRQDFDYARAVCDRHALSERVGHILLSPVHGELDPATLTEWLLAAPIPGARLNLQLHKYVWPAAQRGV